MENDIRSIMELLQKGIITPEEAERMINEIQGNKDYSRKATEAAKNIGEKIGGVIDDVAPKTKGVLKSVFQATADFSQKIANKLDDENFGKQKGFDDSFFNDSYESDFDDNQTETSNSTGGVNLNKEVIVNSEVNQNNVVNATVENQNQVYNEVGNGFSVDIDNNENDNNIESNFFEQPTENEHMIEIEKL